MTNHSTDSTTTASIAVTPLSLSEWLKLKPRGCKCSNADIWADFNCGDAEGLKDVLRRHLEKSKIAGDDADKVLFDLSFDLTNAAYEVRRLAEEYGDYCFMMEDDAGSEAGTRH